MYPWKEALSSWTKSSGLHIDALGLITILGAEEVNVSIGRLVPSLYVEFLPLLGAFLVANNHFTKKQPNFTLYNLTDGIMTQEIAGWFSRWLKMQDFHQIRHRVYWEVKTTTPLSLSYARTALAVSIPCNGILLALTVLSGDWWGFVNALAMIVSVVVRVVLVWQNRAGIDQAVDSATKHQSWNPASLAKVIVVMDDSKIITMKAPRALIGPVFTQTPQVSNPNVYRSSRWIGWAAFAAHIISIGMASLPTQIFTIVLIVISTILTTFKVGCEDWRMLKHLSAKVARGEESASAQGTARVSCRISSKLTAVCSEYPDKDDSWFQRDEENALPAGPQHQKNTDGSRRFGSMLQHVLLFMTGKGPQEKPRLDSRSDSEAQPPSGSAVVLMERNQERPKRRQDLFVWLDLNEHELGIMKSWDIVPHHQNEEWWQEFDVKRKRQQPKEGS